MKEMQLNLNIKEDSDAVEKAKKSKIYYISTDSIKTNPWNWIYDEQDTEEDLMELVKMIKESELQVPLSVCKYRGDYILLSGQRRFNALKRLLEEGTEVSFDGIHIAYDSIPVIIKRECKTEEEMFKIFIASNCYRHLTKETHKRLIAEAVKIYNTKLSDGEVEPGRTRDNIAKLANVDGRTVQRYVDIGKKGQPVSMKKEDVDNDVAQKIKKKLSGIERYFTNLDLEDIDDLSDIKAIAVPAINSIIQRLNIDLSEL